MLFICSGHGESKKFLASHSIPWHTKIIDLSTDFRDESEGFVYGLPEFQKEKIKEAERKIKMVDGEFVLAKDKSSTSRRESLQDGGLGHKQLSLLGAGLKSKQKVEKVISSRIVKKKAAARA